MSTYKVSKGSLFLMENCLMRLPNWQQYGITVDAFCNLCKISLLGGLIRFPLVKYLHLSSSASHLLHLLHYYLYFSCYGCLSWFIFPFLFWFVFFVFCFPLLGRFKCMLLFFVTVVSFWLGSK